MFEVRNLQRSGLPTLSLSVAARELVCLSGPSGAGKTLLLRALADLDPSRGEVRLDGLPREQFRADDWRRQVAYLPAESRWWAATVAEHFAVLVPSQLEALGFGAEAGDWPAERLSSGERQRLALVRVLANRPRVLLLDEPTANLDPLSTRRAEQLVRAYLDETGAACLWVTHLREQIARLAQRSLYLDAAGLHARRAA